jgi:uncharacterized protein (DUF2236 family)
VLAVLFLSVAANLLIAGFTVARFAGPRPGGDIERIVAIGIRAFPPPIRDAIERHSRRDRDRFRQRFDAVREARQGMFEAMRAEPFDRGALDAAFADVRDTTDALQQAGQEIVAGAIAEAPPEARRRIRPPRGPFP